MMANEAGTNNSSSMGNTFRPETIVLFNCVLNVPLMFISIIGNTLVLAAILRTSSLRSPSNILLCSLAVSDLLVGFVVRPLYIASELTENADMYQVLGVMSYAACGVSLMTMCGSVLGSSLSHAISHFDDCTSSCIYIIDSLVHQLHFSNIFYLEHEC